MSEWINIITDSTIEGSGGSLEFTRKAGREIQSLIRRKDFSENEGRRILQYLRSQSEMIPFGSYLKRYLSLRFGIKYNHREQDDAQYREFLKTAFSRTHTPRSFHRSSTSLGVLINGWLRAASVSRETVFLLGFALEMPVEDVSMFLTKAICDQDFNLSDPEETIFWYCFRNRRPAMFALEMIEVYQNTDVHGNDGLQPPQDGARLRIPGDLDSFPLPDGPTIRRRSNLLGRDMNERELIEYLSQLKQQRQSNRYSRTAYSTFVSLLDRAKYEIGEMNAEEDLYVFGKEQERKNVREAEVEKVLYSGVPVDDKGNLMNISFSSLGKGFAKHRLSRQRMSRLLAGKAAVTRYDLLTLLFLNSVLRDDESPIPRYRRFVKNADAMLAHCYMGRLNISNLYEAFLLVCLLTEDPLYAFSEVWEQSYE